MSTDIRLAFAHPEARAEASAPADPRDRISLRDHLVEVEIGAFQAERGVRQRLRFNVVVEIRPHPEPLQDDVDRILSYDRITEAISAALAEERLNLLETLLRKKRVRLRRILLSPPGDPRFFRSRIDPPLAIRGSWGCAWGRHCAPRRRPGGAPLRAVHKFYPALEVSRASVGCVSDPALDCYLPGWSATFLDTLPAARARRCSYGVGMPPRQGAP